ncbi:MAG: histidinol-phosphatase [SAR324 cluster bacterium]|nr:histidinol-phosphatase [SAR324 cluster bacterium]
MLVSLHGGHSGSYCDHAHGTLSDMVAQAVERGFSHYGLTEHMPRSGFLYEEEQQAGRTSEKLYEMFSAYVTEARFLQTNQQSRIHLLVGMEIEVIDSNWDEIRRLRTQYHLDFLVGSIHFVSGIPIDYRESDISRLEQSLGGTSEVFNAYYETQYQMFREIQPEIIGHFDLIRLFRPDFEIPESVWKLIRRNIHYAIAYGALFDVNARAFKKGFGEPYPEQRILQMILEHGGCLTAGDDSHAPQEVGLGFDTLFLFLKKMGIHSLHGLEKSHNGILTEFKWELP